jgi:hypothetical protein
MNPDSGTTNDNKNNNIRKTKAIAAIPTAGIIVVTAALVSGLVVPFTGNSYQPAIAQTGNATITTGGVGQFPCAPVQTGGGEGGGSQNTSTTATTTMGGDAATTTDMNITTTIPAEGNQALGEVAIHIQEACVAAHNNDIPGVLLHLNLALDTLNAFRSLTLDPGGPEIIEGEPEVEPEEEEG